MTQQQTASLPAGQYLTLRLLADTTATQAQDAPLKISGVANDANTTDSFGTRIKLSQRALDAFLSNPVMLLNHDVHNPIGKFTAIEYRGNKLHVEAEVDPLATTNTGANVADLCRKGILKAFSIRFDEASETQQKGFVQIDADVLDEISIVTLPSNRASLFGLRSKGVMLHGAPELLDQEERRRTADLRSQASTRAAGPLSLDLLMSRLRKLVRETCGDDHEYYWDSAYVVAVYDDVLVWNTYENSRFYRVAYAVDAAGNVTLTGEHEEVLPAWTVVGSNPPEATRQAPPNVRATGIAPAAAQRLHPDDLVELTRALRGTPAEPAPAPVAPAPAPADPPPADSDEEISLEEGLASLRGLAPAPAAPTTPALTDEVSLDDVRNSLRSLITPP